MKCALYNFRLGKATGMISLLPIPTVNNEAFFNQAILITVYHHQPRLSPIPRVLYGEVWVTSWIPPMPERKRPLKAYQRDTSHISPSVQSGHGNVRLTPYSQEGICVPQWKYDILQTFKNAHTRARALHASERAHTHTPAREHNRHEKAGISRELLTINI